MYATVFFQTNSTTQLLNLEISSNHKFIELYILNSEFINTLSCYIKKGNQSFHLKRYFIKKHKEPFVFTL